MTHLESKAFPDIELDEEHGALIVLQHRLGLVVQPPVFETADQVFHAFALDADVRCEDVVADGQEAGDDYYAGAVQEGGEGRAEFAHVDDDAGGLGGGGEAPAAGDARVDRAEEGFLRVEQLGVGRECDGHVLSWVMLAGASSGSEC